MSQSVSVNCADRLLNGRGAFAALNVSVINDEADKHTDGVDNSMALAPLNFLTGVMKQCDGAALQGTDFQFRDHRPRMRCTGPCGTAEGFTGKRDCWNSRLSFPACGSALMNFFTVARAYRHPDDAISLRDVWTIRDGELNAISEITCGRLRKEEQLNDLHREVAWAAQALIEFADLANFTPSAKGRFQYKNYLYFEAVSALREATVGILNGSARASTGLLRSVLEMLMLHCWWQERISRKGNSEQFYDWLEGRRAKPGFRDIIANNFDWLGIPSKAAATEHVDRTYERLCSYVHAPIREESITMLNRGNVGQVGADVLRHWLALARDLLRIALEQLVHLYPQCLFPVDINRKFGFNPPVGMYFDKFNFVPLKAVFGEETIETYRVRLKDREIVEGVMNFYRSRPDLSREEILETWRGEDETEAADEESDDVNVLWFRVKAKMRVLS